MLTNGNMIRKLGPLMTAALLLTGILLCALWSLRRKPDTPSATASAFEAIPPIRSFGQIGVEQRVGRWRPDRMRSLTTIITVVNLTTAAQIIAAAATPQIAAKRMRSGPYPGALRISTAALYISPHPPAPPEIIAAKEHSGGRLIGVAIRVGSL